MENFKLGEVGFDEHDIFSPPSLEEKIYFDDSMPPIYDDYNDSYFFEFAPTIINENYYAYVESNNTFMHVDHDKNVLCDSYIGNLFMMLLKVIMREGNMVIRISIILSLLSLC